MPTEDERSRWTHSHGIPGRAAYLWVYDEWLASAPRLGARVVEVGVALGKSLAYLVERLLVEDRKDIEVWAVDPWAGTHQNGEQQHLAGGVGGDFSLYATMMMANAPKAFERVRVLRAPSPRAARLFRFESLDLVILDGDHRFEAVHDDLEAWVPRLHPHGWIGGDDHCEDFPGVEKACRMAFGEPVSDPAGEGIAENRYEVRNEQNWGTWLKRRP